MRYMVVIERGENSWGAHVPDLPGCVAVDETRDEVLQLIREAIGFHIEGLSRSERRLTCQLFRCAMLPRQLEGRCPGLTRACC